MKTTNLLAAAAAVSLFASAAQAAVLTFDGNICNNGSSCADGNTIDQTYGDITGVDVQYDDDGGDFNFWAGAYSDLQNVAWGNSTGGISIFLVAQSGYSVTLNGFDLGAWPNTDRNTQVTIREIGGGVLFSSGEITVDGTVHSSFAGGYTSTSGIEINFGPDNFNVGIDNVDFTATAVDGVVPEPGAWALMILGFGAAGSMLRRRRLVAA